MAENKYQIPAEIDLGEAVRNLSGGQFVFNRYSLVQLLGRGRASAVWQAYDDQGQRDVALKFLPASLAQDAASLQEIKRAVEGLKTLKIPQIAQVYEFEQEDSLMAISMEQVEGSSLNALKSQKKDLIFEAAELKDWLRQICATLEAAHTEASRVHGSIKPNNLIITPKGTVMITGFGIDRKVGDCLNRLAGNKDVSFTLRYSSPQQAQGQKSVVTDDCYGLGATLYDLMTGKAPFIVGNILSQVMEDVPSPMTRRRRDMRIVGEPIPRAWDETVASCLAKEPEKRPQSMVQLAEWIELNPPQAAPQPISDPDNDSAPAPASAAVPLKMAWPPPPTQPTIHPAVVLIPDAPQSAVKKNLIPIIAIAAGIILGLAGWYFMGSSPSAPSGDATNVASKAGEAESQALEKARQEAELKRKKAEEDAKRLTAEVEASKKSESAALAVAQKLQLEAESKRKLAEDQARKLELEIAARRKAEADALAAANKIQAESEAKRKLAEDETKRLEAQIAEQKKTEAARLLALESARKTTDAAKQAEAEQARLDAEAQRLALEKKAKQLSEELAASAAKEKALIAAAEKAKKDAEEQTAKAMAEAKRLAALEETRKKDEAVRVAAEVEAERKRKIEEAARVAELEENRKQMAKLTEAARAPVPNPPVVGVKPPVTGVTAPVAPVAAVVQKPVLGKPWANSLGMRFVPMGEGYFGIWECRFKDFETFVNTARPVVSDKWRNPDIEPKQGPTHPVIYVSYEDAQAFCKWLTDKERKEGLISQAQAYRLPTDEEWSAMAGLPKESGATPAERSDKFRGVYTWGNVWPPPAAAGNYDDKISADRYETTAPAGSFPPNARGVYDLGGNVWEWVQDWGDASQKSRTLRGASWWSYSTGSEILLSSHRLLLSPEDRSKDNGFRVVLGK